MELKEFMDQIQCDNKPFKQMYFIGIQEGDEPGSVTAYRTCYGFKANELLGILEKAQFEIIEQINGAFKPEITKIKRQAIIEDEPE